MENKKESDIKDIVIIGAGGFGREVAWLIEDINQYEKEWNLLGFIDENKELHGETLNGYKVLGGFEFLDSSKSTYYVCAVGNSKIRKEIVSSKCINLKAGSLIHPSVIMSNHIKVGEGCIICAGSILTVNLKLGSHVIVNLDCTVGHDVILGDFVTIYPSVNISGNCIVEEYCEIGTGTQIIQEKKIGSNTIVGAGSVVIKNINENCIVAGIPAKEIKKIGKGY